MLIIIVYIFPCVDSIELALTLKLIWLKASAFFYFAICFLILSLIFHWKLNEKGN